MAEYEKKVRKVLLDNMCYFVRHGKGDHDIWHSPITNANFPVPTRIKARPVANAILKQAGLNKVF